jgi:putative drug exporter of the RND superfamily
MLFRILGYLVCRAWFVLLAGWALLLLAGRLAAPPWDEVAQDKEFAFLPDDARSRRAEAIFAKAFPDDRLASNIVLVLYRTSSAPGGLDEDFKFIDNVIEPGLRQIADADGGLAGEPVPSDEPLFGSDADKPRPPPRRSIFARIRTPNAPGSGALLISPDGQALLVVMELTTDFLTVHNWPTITKVENLIRDLRPEGKIPKGTAIALTGSAVIGRDHTLAQLQSARHTQTLTVVLVIGLLLLIYRAPLLALIPLVAVYLAVQISLDILALLAQAGWITLFEGIQIYVTILAYGAGVDYCLFLTARYKEELDRGAEPARALTSAIQSVGAALTASAATVMCGIGMMVFAQFGKFRDAGFAIPLSIFLVLLATLTFSTSLLRLAGRWSFWPHRLVPVDKGTPGKALLQVGGLEWIWDEVGRHLLRRPALTWLVTVALMLPCVVAGMVLNNRLSYDLIGDLPTDSPSVEGTRVLQEHFPPGIIGPTTVLLVNPQLDFSTAQGRAVVEQVTDELDAQKDKLGLTDVRSLTAPLGKTKLPANTASQLDVPEQTLRQAAARLALEHYVTSLDHRQKIGTRFELILAQGPFTHQSVQDLDRIDSAMLAALPEDLRPDTHLYFVGTTASVRDLANVIQGDRRRIELLVVVAVLVILIVLLRRLVVSVYLLLSVLFSYFATLGVSFAVFWLLDPQGFAGLDWKVAIFLFTILIAVGEDYNIFLLTRIHEEKTQHGPVGGILQALTKTGPIITSCGIIMAGTFASLLSGSLMEMKQLGFALVFGVLLDTFVVRPVLVPAFLILLVGRKKLADKAL